MEIIAQTTPETASALLDGRHTPETDRVEEVLATFGVHVEPLFRFASKGDSVTFFTIQSADPADANSIVARLRPLPGIISAYVKAAAAPAGALVSKPVSAAGFGRR